MKQIAIVGINSRLGTYLIKELSKKFTIILISRTHNSKGHCYAYDQKKPRLQQINNIDVLVNCAYDYKDKDLRNNVNVRITKNLLKFAEFNKIPNYLNISSINAYKNCKTVYGKVKEEIEELVKNNKGTSLKIGLLYQNNNTFVLDKIIKLNDILKKIGLSIGIKKEFEILLTSCQSVANFLSKDMKKNKIFTLVDKRISFNKHIKPEGTIQIKIYPKIIFGLLSLMKLVPIKIKNYDHDGFIGLMNHPKKIKTGLSQIYK